MIITDRAAKAARPETPDQVRTWDTNYSKYKRAGFCRRCAAQAAWGHQNGFANTQPVNECCRGKIPPNSSVRALAWSGRHA